MVTNSSLEAPYLSFTREQWRQYRSDTPLLLNQDELEQLRGFNESISLQEVEDIYLPLARLVNLYVNASQQLHKASSQFLGNSAPRVPYIIGVSGSVAVGKSTTSRILQTLLSRFAHHPRVDLITTDGYLYPNRFLVQHHLMEKKGFPESFDTKRLLRFLIDVKSGYGPLNVPLYSHEIYDVLETETKIVNKPDILIIEGLNILQSNTSGIGCQPRLFVSDFLDFTIYVDAPTAMISNWFTQRFMAFREQAREHPHLFFHQFSQLSDNEALAYAANVWHDINEANLHANILPFKHRARLILTKTADHSINDVLLRKL